MKILVLTSYKYGSFSGQGLIVTNTIDCFQKNNIEYDVVYYRCEEYCVTDRKLGKKCIQECKIGGISKITIIKNIAGLSLNRQETKFLEDLSNVSRQYSVILVFLSAFDPILNYLPDKVCLPIVLHITDSITRFEENRKTNWINLRIPIARFIERRFLRKGYRKVVYVGCKDAEIARNLSGEYCDKILFLPNGVSSTKFYPKINKSSSGIITILFTGVLSYAPNEEACIYTIKKILPLLKGQYLFKIVGKSPSERLKNIAKSNSSVKITGYVDDIASEYQESDIFLCLMQSGAGVKNKILEALASGLPVITSSLEFESFGCETPGVSYCCNIDEIIARLNFYIGSEKDRFIDGAKGREFILSKMTWDIRTRKLMEIF